MVILYLFIYLFLCFILCMHYVVALAICKVNWIAVHNQNHPREITCHMGLHSVTYHPAAVTFPTLPQPKQVLDLVTQ